VPGEHKSIFRLSFGSEFSSLEIVLTNTAQLVEVTALVRKLRDRCVCPGRRGQVSGRREDQAGLLHEHQIMAAGCYRRYG